MAVTAPAPISPLSGIAISKLLTPNSPKARCGSASGNWLCASLIVLYRSSPKCCGTNSPRLFTICGWPAGASNHCWTSFIPFRAPHLRKLRRRLKQARKVLGELRNQDVLVARIARVLARKRAARREAWEAGHEYVVKLRSKTVERAHRELSRLNLAQVYVRLRQELTAFEEPGASKAEPSSPHSVALPGPVPAGAPSEHPIASGRETDAAARFAKRLGELWNDFDALAAKSRRDPAVLHPLRIATKRLRYLVEVAAALNVGESSEALHWLHDLQGKLGDWHDLEVLDATLIDMLARPKFLRANLPLAVTVERLILGLRASKTRHCHSYLRRALQSGAYRQTAAWVNQSAIRQPLPAG